jgi:hypothetical protein
MCLCTGHRLSFASASVITGRVVFEAHGSGFSQQTHDRWSPRSTMFLVVASKIYLWQTEPLGSPAQTKQRRNVLG